MVPTRPRWCGSVNESPLFSAFVMRHPCILVVYFMSHHIMSHYSIHICIPVILCCPFWPPVILSPSPQELSRLLPGQPCTLWCDKGSRQFFPQSPFPHYPWCQSMSHTTIFPHALVEDHHFLIYRGPYFVDFSSFIPEERPRGQFISIPTSILVWCLGLSKGSHYFPLNWSFHVHDPYTWWSSDAVDCPSDSWVCVICFRPHEEVAPHMPECIPTMLQPQMQLRRFDGFSSCRLQFS